MELALLVPALMLVAGLLLAGGRIWLARTAVADAAYSAARSAALARSPGQAHSDGLNQGYAAMQQQLNCTSTSVTVDVTGFAVAVGTPATVTTDARCVVALSDLLVPGLPGSMSISARGSAALDTFRGRQ